MFESYGPVQEKGKKLRNAAEILKRFVLTGALLLGAEIGLRPTIEPPKNYSLAEILEMVDEEDREMFLELARGRIQKPVSIESYIPAREKDVRVSEIKKYIDTLPKGWVRGEINSIGLATEKNDPEEGVPAGALAVFYYDSGKVIFDPSVAGKQERGYNLHTLSHEIAHGNDFLTDADMSWEKRHFLYRRLKERLQSENRFRTFYLMELEKAFHKHEYGLFPLMREYWAEINAQYMSDPTQLHVDDFELVDSFVKINDPNYRWKEKLGERAKIQGEFSNPHIPEK